MPHRPPWLVAAALAIALPLAPAAIAGDRPNFVLIIADDVSHDDYGFAGHPTIKTPNLDQMAAEGLVFENAYLTCSSCSPTRCSLITGRYPHNTGAPELHSELPEGQFLFPAALREAGYYTALSGKHHMGPNADPAFSTISTGGKPSGSRDWVQVLRDRPQDQPFFCWFAAYDAHRKWQLNELAPKYTAEDAVVPPFMVDGPRTREDLASYYHEVSRNDYYVGEVRKELERQGIADNTYVIYLADNGRPFPRCKTRLYDSGIKTPLVIWAPRRVTTARSESLVSTIDLAPTILGLAGVSLDPRLQGVSLAPVLAEPTATVRDYVFAEQNWHVFAAHQRMALSGDWMYIRNNRPDLPALSTESNGTYSAGKKLATAHAEGRLAPQQQDVFLLPRPTEELYRVDQDPHQLDNLAADPAHSEQLDTLRALMDRWVDETGDTVPRKPTPTRRPGGRKRPNPGEMPGESAGATTIVASGPIRDE